MADRKVKLILSMETIGAKRVVEDVEKVEQETRTLQSELAKIARANQFQKIGTEAGLAAKKFRDVGTAVADLNKKLAELGASKDEIASAAGAFESARTGGGSNVLARAGSELRALPSTQTGLGFGTDAVGNVLRLSGALTEVAGKSALTTGAINLLTPALGAQTAATLGAAAPIALFVAGFGAIAIALKSLTDATGQNAEAITAYAEAQRELNADIVQGLTTEEAKKKIEELNEARRLEQELLDKNKAAYAAFEKQATDAGTSIDDFGSTLSKIVFGANAVGDVAKAISADEQAIADNIAASEKNIESFAASADTLNVALESGRLAANDAKIAEEELAKTRSDAALKTADSAGKELAARQKADAATGEQNEKRLEAIANEKEVLQAQIDSLTSSGAASEQVAEKIASLTEQLNLLGDESKYISETALEASRAADVEKQAKKDAEDATKKAAQAQDQYNQSVQSAAATYKQAVEDSGIRLRYTLIDNAEKTNRDLLSLDTKYQQDEFDLRLKAGRSEREAVLDQIDDIDKIRKEAQKSEQEALREGDFKQLFLNREAAKEAQDEQQDQLNKEALRRQYASNDALEDLRRNDQRQREAKLQSYEYANTDAQTAANRELAQARLTQNRALAQASAGLNADLAMRGQYWQAVMKQTQNAINQITGKAGASTQGASASSPFGSFENSFTTAVRR